MRRIGRGNMVQKIWNKILEKENVRQNLSKLRELIKDSKNKDITSIDFLTFALSAKPNTKNKNILRQKEITEILLSENSAAYARRKSRIATKNSYYNSITKYYALIVNQSNK